LFWDTHCDVDDPVTDHLHWIADSFEEFMNLFQELPEELDDEGGEADEADDDDLESDEDEEDDAGDEGEETDESWNGDEPDNEVG